MKLTGTFWVVLPYWSKDDQDIAEHMQDPRRCFDLESVAQMQYREDLGESHDKGEYPRIVKVKAEYSFTEVEPEKRGGITC